MPSTGISSLDKVLLDSYHDESTIFVGPPRIRDGVFSHWFTHLSLIQNDFFLYATGLSSREVTQNLKVFDMDLRNEWLSNEDNQIRLDIHNLSEYVCMFDH